MILNRVVKALPVVSLCCFWGSNRNAFWLLKTPVWELALSLVTRMHIRVPGSGFWFQLPAKTDSGDGTNNLFLATLMQDLVWIPGSSLGPSPSRWGPLEREPADGSSLALLSLVSQTYHRKNIFTKDNQCLSKMKAGDNLIEKVRHSSSYIFLTFFNMIWTPWPRSIDKASS